MARYKNVIHQPCFYMIELLNLVVMNKIQHFIEKHLCDTAYTNNKKHRKTFIKLFSPQILGYFILKDVIYIVCMELLIQVQISTKGNTTG